MLDHTLDVTEAGAPVDSALLFGVAVSHWAAGLSLADGLAATVQTAQAVGGGRLSFLAADGDHLAGTAYGDPLFVHQSGAGVLLASEPLDEDPGWRELPPRSLVSVDHGTITVTGLDG